MVKSSHARKKPPPKHAPGPAPPSLLGEYKTCQPPVPPYPQRSSSLTAPPEPVSMRPARTGSQGHPLTSAWAPPDPAEPVALTPSPQLSPASLSSVMPLPLHSLAWTSACTAAGGNFPNRPYFCLWASQSSESVRHLNKASEAAPPTPHHPPHTHTHHIHRPCFSGLQPCCLASQGCCAASHPKVSLPSKHSDQFCFQC